MRAARDTVLSVVARALRFLALLSGVMAITPSLARADESTSSHTATLTYAQGDAATCPSESSFRNAIVSRLGYDPFTNDGATASHRLHVDVTFSRIGKGQKIRAQVDVKDAAGKPAGSRELRSDGEDCTDLAASLAIAVSIAIDPQSLTRSPAAAPSSSPSVAREPAPLPIPEPAPPPVPPLPPSPPPDAPPGPEVELAFGGSGTFLAQPTTALGTTLAIGIRLPRWSVALEGRAEFGLSSQMLGGAVVYTHMPQGTLFGCGHFGNLALCGAVTLGAFHASTDSGAAEASETRAFALAGPRVAYDLPLTSTISLRGALDLRLALTRVRLHFDGQEVWKSPSPIVPSVAFAVVVHFR